MNDFKCLDCRFEFNEPTIITETHGLNSPPYEEHSVCPNCGGDFTDLIECDLCGRGFTTEDEVFDGICADCIKKEYSTALGMKYLAETDIEALFYIDNYFNSNILRASAELLGLCRDAYMNDLNYKGLNESASRKLKGFVYEEFADYAEWYVAQRKAKKGADNAR